jgi:probable F420-dependent oxidoreductase
VDRYGLTIPLDGVAFHDLRVLVRELAELGYTDVWSSEAGGADAFTPLALAATWGPALRLGSAIAAVHTRGPAVLAQTAATLAAAAPGRFALGIGASTEIVVSGWNGLPYDRPYQRVRDTIRFLREALTGAKVSRSYETFRVSGFRLALVPEQPPPILVAALRPGMLRLAGREADGAIINWLSAEDVAAVTPLVHQGAPGKEVVARIFVAPTGDAERARAAGRRLIATYLNVPAYRAFHEWLGRGSLATMWRLWAAGERRAAADAVPDEVVDALIVHGTPDACREHVHRYVKAGVTTPVLALLPVGGDPRDHVRALAPSGGS